MATKPKTTKPAIKYGEGEPTTDQSGDFYVDLITDIMYHKPDGEWVAKIFPIQTRQYQL